MHIKILKLKKKHKIFNIQELLVALIFAAWKVNISKAASDL